MGKLISIPSVEVVLYRTLIACIGLFVLLKLRKINLLVSRRMLWMTLGTGVIIAFHWILFFLAAQVSNISVCLAGMATTSLWTSLVDPLFNRRKVKVFELAISMLSVVGIVVVFQSDLSQPMGFIIALASALLSAIFTVINGKLIEEENHYTITFYEMLGALFITLLFLPVYTSYFTDGVLQLALTLSDFGYLMILGIICTVYAYSLGVKLMKQLTAFTINLTINLEPVYGIIVAVVIFQEEETMGRHFYIGTFIILLSVLLYPVLRKLIIGKNIKGDLVR